MSSSESAKSAYSRFIPREELGPVAAWTPGAIGDATQGARPQSADVQAQAARQAGYQDGYRDGLAALDSFKSSFARSMSERVGVLLASFDAELLSLEQRIAAAVADCATSLARQVVRGEVTTQPQLVARVAEEAVATLLPSARHIRVHVHPDDLALIADGAGEALAARDAKLVGDAALTRGGCRIESDIGSVDATLESRWARACAALTPSAQGLAELGPFGPSQPAQGEAGRARVPADSRSPAEPAALASAAVEGLEPRPSPQPSPAAAGEGAGQLSSSFSPLAGRGLG